MVIYKAYGKQIRRGTEHVADAADETYAQIIADALNGERDTPERIANRMGGTFDTSKVTEAIRELRDPISDNRKRFHHVSSRIGGYECACGRRWDFDDGDDTCPAATR